MADSVQKIIEIVFAGDDNVSGVIKGISTNVSAFGDGLESVVSPLAGITDNILKLNAALALLVSGGLAFAFTKSVELESAIVELEKVLGEQEKVTVELRESWTALSREYGVSTTSIVQSLAELRQSGFDVADSMEVLNTSLKLSRASELETEAATNLLKRSLIGYKLNVKDAIVIGDLWNKTSQVANTNVSKLAEGFAIVSRQASDAGFSLTETSAALTPIIGVFDSGSEAGIAFSLALTSLLNPTKEGEEAIRKLTGVTGPLNEEFKTGKDLYEAVAAGLQKVSDQSGAIAVAQIVGARQAKRIKVSFDDYATTLKKIGPALSQVGSLQGEVDKQNKTTQVSLDRLRVGFGQLAVVIGDQYREAVKTAIDGGVAIENSLEDLVKAGTFDELFKAIREASTELGKFLAQIATALPEAFKLVDFDPLLSSLGDLEDAFRTFFKDIDLTTPEGLANAIQFVVDSIASLIRTTEGLIGPLGIFVKKILEAVDAFNELEEGTKKTTGEVLGWSKVIDTILGPLGSFLKAVESLSLGLNVLIGVQVASVLASWGVTFTAIATTATVAGANIVASFKLIAAIMVGTTAGLTLLATAAGIAIGSLARLIPGVDEATKSVLGFLDFLFGISDKTQFEIDLDISEAQKNAAILRKQIAEKQQDIQIDLDTKLVDRKFADIEKTLSGLQGRLVTIDIETELDNAEISRIKKVLDETFGDAVTIDIETEFHDAEIDVIKKILDETFGDSVIIDIEALLDNIQIDRTNKALDDLQDRPVTIGIETELDSEKLNQIKKILNDLQDRPVEVTVEAVLDSSKIRQIQNALNEAFNEVHIGLLEADDFDFNAVLAKGEEVAGSLQEQLDQFAKDPIVIDIEAETKVKIDPNSKAELQKIRAQADTLQTALEFSAKIEIADIEADAKIMASAFDAVGESVNAVSDTTSEMFVAFTGFKGTVREKSFLANILRDQADSQNELVSSQIDLNLAQEEFLREKTEVLAAGGGLITISADGLEPELEAFMFKIIDKVQIAATESQSEFLLGIS